MRDCEESSGTAQPGVIRRVFGVLKRLARRVGNVQARVILAVFYCVALAPFALFVRWTQDPLGLKAGTPRGWRAREATDDAVGRARKQF